MAARNYHRVMGRLINRPLFAHARTAMTVYNALCGRFGEGFGAAMLPATPDASVIDELAPKAGARRSERLDVLSSRFEGEMVKNEGGGFPRVEPFMRTAAGVAIIPIMGETVNRGAWVGEDESGGTSYEGLGFQLKRAAQDSKTKVILLDGETPGGEAIGTTELAALVRQINAIKPVHFIANGMAASAGYAIASGAKSIINTPSGLIGSIGCVMLHMDMSKALEMKGMAPTLIFEGAHKVDGNPTAPLTDDVREELQAEVRSFYQLFTETVGQGRGRRLSAKAARETEARTYIGQAAVDAGLADAVGTFDEAIQDATDKARKLSGSNRSSSRSTSSMATGINADEPITIEQHNAALAAATAKATADATTKATADAQAAVNARIAAIRGDARVAGKLEIAMDLAMKSPSMSAEDVCAFVAGLPTAAAPAPSPSASHQQRREETGAGGVGAVGPTAGGGNGQGGEDYSWGPHISKANKQREAVTRARRTPFPS